MKKFFVVYYGPTGLMVAAGLFVSVFTILGFFGGFFWMSDILASFRVQYLVILTFLAVLLFLCKRPKSALLFSAFAATNLVVILPVFFGTSYASHPSDTVIRALGLNLNRGNTRFEQVRTLISQTQPDILLLTEFNSRWKAEMSNFLKPFPYQALMPREDSFGIAIFSKLPIGKGPILNIGDGELPAVLTKVNANETTFFFAGLHPFPPLTPEMAAWRNRYLDDMTAALTRETHPVIMMGDFNTTPWSESFYGMLASGNLKDCTKGLGWQPTWPTTFSMFMIPLDHCLHTAKIRIVDKWIGNDVGSDHLPVIVDFIVEP